MVLLLKLSRRGHLKEKFQRFAQFIMRFFDRGVGWQHLLLRKETPIRRPRDK